MMSTKSCYIILGSGGHTGEMCKINIALLKSKEGDKLYNGAKYLVANTDVTSRKKLRLSMENAGIKISDDAFIEIPRSREVGQNWFTTIFTTLWSLLWSFKLIWNDRPRLILCNGPGTCVPFCIAAYCLRLFGRLDRKSKIVFIESYCRVQTLSLSGRLLLPFVDLVVVQWKSLADRYKSKPNIKYFGRLM